MDQSLEGLCDPWTVVRKLHMALQEAQGCTLGAESITGDYGEDLPTFDFARAVLIADLLDRLPSDND